MKRRQQAIVLAAVLLVSLAWLWALYLFPEGWQDRHGNNQLMWLILFSAMHLPVGLLLIFSPRFALFSWRFVFVLVATPFIHWFGASIVGYWSDVLFVSPTIVTATLGLLEMRSSEQMEST